ncbi:MAG: CocE/NonD family hydrolase [Candidatus Dadabacteria bacterium]|nr:MAG: CocE/NonD family hydrolase [Candidatus Dadabacteria bacterium]
MSRFRAFARSRIIWMFALAVALPACNDAGGNAPFTVREGVKNLTVLDAEPFEPLTLYAPDGTRLLTLITDELGQAHFEYVPSEYVVIQTGEGGDLPSYDGTTLEPGSGYIIRDDSADPVIETGPLRVLGVNDVPDDSFYDQQKLVEGLNYITMRDGVKLSATVWYPDTAICGPGPWPTVVNYSGYSPSNPDNAPPGVQIATLLLCYAGVGVNMRGTGCSGGVYDIFDVAQHADGYDIIEVVARQWFAKGGKVGMIGLSYPGISQLYVAYTRPPHLAAVAPLSVIEDPWRQAWPGGIYNSGFTQQWIQERDKEATAGGQSWVQKQIDGGDTTCAENQKLRSQNVNFEVFSQALTTFPEAANERRLSNLVPKINVPLFLTGAWQDEQTGSRFATMLDDITGTTIRRFTMFNGRHPDGYTPLTLTRLAEFLSFYVAKEIPRINPALRLLDSVILKEIFDADDLHFEEDRFGQYQSYDEALKAYESEPVVRVLFESGYGSDVTEAPVARFERTFTTWPPPGAQKGEWYLSAPGALTTETPSLTGGDNGIDAFLFDPEAGDKSYILKDSLFHIAWDWQYADQEHALGYQTDPLPVDTMVIGNGGYVDLWMASNVTDPVIEASILEVRPDGTEFLVQSGAFRAAHRNGIDRARSQEFLIEYTYAATQMSYPPANEFFNVKVPIRPFAHAFRKGSRIRLVFDTPGRDQGFWEYKNPVYDRDDAKIAIARTPDMPSKLILPLFQDFDIPDDPPPCYSLRGIVCRDYLALPNTAVTWP